MINRLNKDANRELIFKILFGIRVLLASIFTPISFENIIPISLPFYNLFCTLWQCVYMVDSDRKRWNGMWGQFSLSLFLNVSFKPKNNFWGNNMLCKSSKVQGLIELQYFFSSCKLSNSIIFQFIIFSFASLNHFLLSTQMIEPNLNAFILFSVLWFL